MKTTAFMGEHDLRSIRLNAQEKQALLRAALVFEKLRERLEDGRVDCDDDTTVDVAMAAHTCRFVVGEESLPII